MDILGSVKHEECWKDTASLQWDFFLSKSLIFEYNCGEMLFILIESENKGRLISWSRV